MIAIRRLSSIPTALLGAAALCLPASVTLAPPAHATGHRDTIYQACLNDSGDAQGCACLADTYERELSDTDLAFYARLLARAGAPGAMQEVAQELGLSRDEIGPIVRRQIELDARARRDCGLGAAE